MNKFRSALLAALLAVTVTTTGCFGKFALSQKAYNWNNSFGNKFVKTLVFWVFCIVPVYEATIFVDYLIFNLIEFWTGSNPLAMKDGDTLQRVVEAHGQRAVLTFSDRGRTVRIDGPGTPLLLQVRENGAKLTRLDGTLVSTSTGTAAGGVEVRDPSGKLIAEASAHQVTGLAAASQWTEETFVAQMSATQSAVAAR